MSTPIYALACILAIAVVAIVTTAAIDAADAVVIEIFGHEVATEFEIAH